MNQLWGDQFAEAARLCRLKVNKTPLVAVGEMLQRMRDEEDAVKCVGHVFSDEGECLFSVEVILGTGSLAQRLPGDDNITPLSEPW